MWYDTRHDLQQLRTDVPLGVQPEQEIVIRGAAYCPKCGADNYWAFSFYEDDPMYCTTCQEPVNEVGNAAIDLPSQQGRTFGDDAMDGAEELGHRNFELLYGWNDDSPHQQL